MAAQGRTATVAEMPSRGTKRTSRNGPVRRVLPLGFEPSREPPADLDVAILGHLAPMQLRFDDALKRVYLEVIRLFAPLGVVGPSARCRGTTPRGPRPIPR